MWIEMVMHMSGTRANGDKYPPGWTSFEVADWEGEHLIKGGMAREVATPAWAVPVPPAPMPVPVTALPPAPEADPEAEAVTEPAVPSGDRAPAPADSKQAWVDYAVTQGMAADDAARMTKADLQSRYGPRL